MQCEGLGDWRGHATWLVRFRQRSDRPNHMHSYGIGGQIFPVALKGVGGCARLERAAAEHGCTARANFFGDAIEHLLIFDRTRAGDGGRVFAADAKLYEHTDVSDFPIAVVAPSAEKGRVWPSFKM